MKQGYTLHTEATILVGTDDNDGEERLEFERTLLEVAQAQELEVLSPPPTPLRPSLCLSASTSSFAWDSNSRLFESSSSLDVPSLASSQTSANCDSSCEDDDPNQGQEDAPELIPYPEPGVHFHARHKEFVIIAPSSAVHRLVTVEFNGSSVHKVHSRKPLGVHVPSFSPNDIVLSARGENHIAVVRRGAKSNKISLTIQGRSEY